jgi:hypothetical protein
MKAPYLETFDRSFCNPDLTAVPPASIFPGFT